MDENWGYPYDFGNTHGWSYGDLLGGPFDFPNMTGMTAVIEKFQWFLLLDLCLGEYLWEVFFCCGQHDGETSALYPRH